MENEHHISVSITCDCKPFVQHWDASAVVVGIFSLTDVQPLDGDTEWVIRWAYHRISLEHIKGLILALQEGVRQREAAGNGNGGYLYEEEQ